MDLSFALRRKAAPTAQPIELHRLLARVGANQAMTLTAIAQARLERAASSIVRVDPRVALFGQKAGEVAAPLTTARFAWIDEAAFSCGQPN